MFSHLVRTKTLHVKRVHAQGFHTKVVPEAAACSYNEMTKMFRGFYLYYIAYSSKELSMFAKCSESKASAARTSRMLRKEIKANNKDRN